MNWRTLHNQALFDYIQDLELPCTKQLGDKNIRLELLAILELNGDLIKKHPTGRYKDKDLKKISKEKIMLIAQYVDVQIDRNLTKDDMITLRDMFDEYK